MTISERTEQLIGACLNGELSPEQEAELMQWIREADSNKNLFYRIKDTWDSMLPVSADVNEQLLDFYRKQAQAKKARAPVLPRWAMAAAAVALLVLGLFAARLVPFVTGDSKSMVESFDVPNGSRSRIVLADGTKINLNSDSHLRLAADFSGRHRELSLEGEAYFDVKPDKHHPFTVHTPKFDILVTGTRFNVSSYREDTHIGATLAEGRIQLQTKTAGTILLKPGQKISFNQHNMKPLISQADVGSELAWVEGEFNFKDIPFPDLIRRLERWYDVKLMYEGTDFDSMLYTGRFKNQETIRQVLDALKLTTSIDYEKTDSRKFKLHLKNKTM